MQNMFYKLPYWISFMVLFLGKTAQGQIDSAAIETSVNPGKKWNLKIRQSFQSEDTKPEPAILTATFPKNGPHSFLIDAAAGLTRELSQRFFIQAETEYHRNTLIDKQQNNFQIGVGGRAFFDVKNERGADQALVLNTNVKYNRIYAEKPSEGLLVTLDFTWFQRNQFDPTTLCKNSYAFNAPIRCVLGSQQFNAFISPNAGFEYENHWKAESDSAKGHILRGVLKGYVSLTPMAKDKRGRYLKRIFDIYIDYTNRYTFLGTLHESAGWRPLLDAGINIPIYPHEGDYNKLSLGFSYRYGQNPAQGLARQEFWLIAFKVKL
ncbi:hypothetical protein GCM10027347_56380 [Larkinella harenae]